MEHPRYRATENALSIGFLFGALSATELSGTVLVGLLGGLGLNEAAARNALTRMVGVRALASRRVGRARVYFPSDRLLGKYRQVLGKGPNQDWDGIFHCLVYDIPERERTYRDRFRYIAEFSSYSPLRPGVLISPRVHSEHLRTLISERPLGTRVHVTQLRPVDEAQAKQLAQEAWDLPDLARRYERLTTVIEDELGKGLAPEADSSEWLWGQVDRWRRLYREVIRLQFADPALPDELLPPDWPEPTYRDRLNQLDSTWGPVLLPRLRAFTAELDKAGLCSYQSTPYFVRAPAGATGSTAD